MGFCFVVLVFPMVFRKPKKPSGKPNMQKTTKENNNNLRENINKKNNKHICLKGFRPTLGYGFVFFVCFPEGFEKTKKTCGKTNNTKENHKHLRENKQKQSV